MIDILAGQALLDGLGAITAGMAGDPLAGAFNSRINKYYDTDEVPIGYTDWTSDEPAISGNTGGSISTGAGATPVDAWNDYVENEHVDVSEVTGGIVAGSTVGTLMYSLMEVNSGTPEAAVMAVAPVSIPVNAAFVAIGQALGVSISDAELDTDTKESLIETIVSAGGIVYDKASNLVTAWKDEWGRILFPKKAVEAVNDKLTDLGIPLGGEDTGKTTTSDVVVTPVTVLGGDVRVPWKSPSMECVSGGTAGAAVSNPSNLTRCRIITASASPFTWKRYRLNTATGVESNITTGEAATYVKNGLTVYRTWFDVACDSGAASDFNTYNNNEIAWALIYGNIIEAEYPNGTSRSSANYYTPSTYPIAGNLALSYDPSTGELITEPLVPIHITEDPYDSTGDTADPTDPTSNDNTGVLNPPIPTPVPDTNASNPEVPLVNPSIINSTRVNELVEELANTLDPQPAQSSGIIPVPPLPGIFDPSTGHSTFPSIIPDSGPGFIHVYNPTPSEFISFGNWLWVTYADATIDKILNNPFDGVIGAHELYATPNRDGRDNIRSAFLVCPTSADLVQNRYSEIDCGTIIVPEFYGNYLDYSPYSQAYIYLPFIGINEVSIDDIVGHAVNIRYRIDSYSGSCIAMIFVAKEGYQNLCYQFAGSCSVEVPMAGGSQAAIKAGMMQAEAYARASMINSAGNFLSGAGSAFMGNWGGAISSIGNIASNYANAQAGVEAARVANKSSVQHSGQFGASHGAMGQKIPFIIIRNPIQVKVVNYNEDYGFPAHKRVIIGGCTGYLRVREVNVISAHATDDEKAAIEAMLKNGVYVS